MRLLRTPLCIILIFIIISSFLLGFYPKRAHAQKREDIQKIIEDILTLDARVLALQKKINELSKKNHELRANLEKKRSELLLLDKAFQKRQDQLSQWILFSFKGGMGNLLSVLVGAEDLGDFFRRFDNIVFFLEYYNNMIVEIKDLIDRRKQEELSIMQKQREIQNMEDQTRVALERLTDTIATKQKELKRAKLVLKDTTFLEEISEGWQEALPSLDYLLKNLSKLPWSSLGPDNLKVNYFNLTARAEFYDKSVSKVLLSKNKKLKNVSLTFSPQGITVSEKNPKGGSPIYSVTCTMKLTKDQKVQFTPKNLEFNGIKLPPKVIQELMADYETVFTPPPLPYNLKIVSIKTEKGKLIMNFKK